MYCNSVYEFSNTFNIVLVSDGFSALAFLASPVLIFSNAADLCLVALLTALAKLPLKGSIRPICLCLATISSILASRSFRFLIESISLIADCFTTSS